MNQQVPSHKPVDQGLEHKVHALGLKGLKGQGIGQRERIRRPLEALALPAKSDGLYNQGLLPGVGQGQGLCPITADRRLLD